MKFQHNGHTYELLAKTPIYYIIRRVEISEKYRQELLAVKEYYKARNVSSIIEQCDEILEGKEQHINATYDWFRSRNLLCLLEKFNRTV